MQKSTRTLDEACEFGRQGDAPADIRTFDILDLVNEDIGKKRQDSNEGMRVHVSGVNDEKLSGLPGLKKDGKKKDGPLKVWSVVVSN